VGTQRPDFAEFYRRSKDECLRTVLVSVGDRDTAQDLVDEAFTSELITAVRESFAGVHSATPVEQIASRSRAVRARRRVPGLAAALAVAAGAVVAVTALAPGHHQPARPPGVQLAAWTVVKQSDGTVSVTIRELRDPAGLQRTLRADGIPASVTFFGRTPRSCQGYPLNVALVNRVFTSRYAGGFPVMVIHVPAIPHGAGVQINPVPQPVHNVAIGLVYATPACTGR
jgi:hypothetical protein